MATIVITGANRGIGLELARQYALAGHDVVRTIRGSDSAEAPIGGTLSLDVTDAASVAHFAQALEGVAIDLLINNAGISGPTEQSSTAMDFAGFTSVLDANVLGPLRVTQALLPNLRKAPAAKIGVVSSLMGSLASAQSGHVAYRASKAAVNKVFQCLATDLTGEGIAVTMLHPGWVRTDMGGPNADIDVQTSVSGIRSVLDALDMSRTGRFYAYYGKELAW